MASSPNCTKNASILQSPLYVLVGKYQGTIYLNLLISNKGRNQRVSRIHHMGRKNQIDQSFLSGRKW